MLCRTNYIDTFLKTLNNADKNIKFKIEKCSNGSISFLDKELKIVNNKIHSKWYSKPIKGEKTMNFNAAVPFKWKKSNAIGFINRIIFSSYDDQTTDLDLIKMKRILTKNNYPYKLICDLIDKHATNFKNKRNILWEKISNNELHPKTPKIDNNNITLWNLKIPYLSPQIEKIIAKLNYVIRTNFTDIRINIIYTSKKLFSVLKPLLKPTVNPIDKQEVIYKFTCDCSDSYIGETGIILERRINQHCTQSQSSIYEHITSCDTYLLNAIQHPISHLKHFTELFTILDSANNQTNRRIKESSYILCEQPNLNDQIKDHIYRLYGT